MFKLIQMKVNFFKKQIFFYKGKIISNGLKNNLSNMLKK